MPYTTDVAAIIAKYDTLTAANFPNATRPPLWLDEAPAEGTTGATQRIPYAIIDDDGTEYEWTFGTTGMPASPGENAILRGRVTITVYYDSLANASQAMDAILWNGSLPNARAGIAFMTMDLSSPYRSMTVKPEKSENKYAGFSYQAKPVYRVSTTFRTLIGLYGAGTA